MTAPTPDYQTPEDWEHNTGPAATARAMEGTTGTSQVGGQLVKVERRPPEPPTILPVR